VFQGFALNGHLKVMKLLVETGVDVNVERGGSVRTPSTATMKETQIELAESLRPSSSMKQARFSQCPDLNVYAVQLR
jgi:hypothetical protein